MAKDRSVLLGPPDEEHKPVVTTPELPPKIRQRDNLGLSMEPSHWAKQNCNNCYGRGWISKFSGVVICFCSSNRYMKIRTALEDTILNIHANLDATPEKKAEASLAVLDEAKKQLVETGHVNRVILAKLATEILSRKIELPRKAF